jgi:hypothetical protein
MVPLVANQLHFSKKIKKTKKKKKTKFDDQNEKKKKQFLVRFLDEM